MSNTHATTIAISILAAAGISYALYFDYKRRNDASFRRKLRKEKKKVDKTVAQSKTLETEAEGSGATGVSPEALREALQKIRQEEAPTTTDDREQYFMSQVAVGEQLAVQGPAFHLQAALSFFRALRVYPAPVELIMIYQKTVPPAIFAIVMELTNLDVSTDTASAEPAQEKVQEAAEVLETSPTRSGPPSETSSQEWDQARSRAEGYFDHFPPESMNVGVDSRKVTDSKGNIMERKCLVAKKDFAAGDLIYTEHPIVATLDADLEGKGGYCSYCFRTIPEDAEKIASEDNGLSSVYCSMDCQSKAKSQYETLFFSTDSVIPPAIAAQSPEAPVDKDARKEAQAKYIAYLKESTKTAPLLVAKILGLQVEVEMSKLMSAAERKPSSEYADEEYSIHDHLERLRYLEVVPPPEEPELLSKVLATAMPGLDQFISDERYSILLGKMMYNSFGVSYDGGREDRPESIHRPEDSERTRISLGTNRQIGSAFFKVSSYIVHSCAPTGRVAFPTGTSELHLYATQDIKKGEEITVAYVDVAQHDGESVMEARRRRRIELARGWRFACTCSRCLQESLEVEASSSGEKDHDDVGPMEDGSKVDKAVENFEERMKGGLM